MYDIGIRIFHNIYYTIIVLLKYSFFILTLFLIAGCAPSDSFHHEYASGHYSAGIIQCAPYARSISGVHLYGDAYSWWAQAAHVYQRGNTPMPGAILVLKKTTQMRYGHVAMVKKVLSSREIIVTHSNWGNSNHTRHIIYDAMRVLDITAQNNWSVVTFWNDEKNAFGLPYSAYGFIYP